MSKPVVLVAEELSPAGIAVLEADFDVRHVDGSDKEQLLPAVADVDALIVRSATTVTAEVFQHAKKLRVVARAGVGLDTVEDVHAPSIGAEWPPEPDGGFCGRVTLWRWQVEPSGCRGPCASNRCSTRRCRCSR